MKNFLQSPVIIVLGVITIAELFVVKKIDASITLWVLYGLYKIFKE